MKPHVVIAADNLSAADAHRVIAATEGWATCERITHDSPRLGEALRTAEILVGWADPALIRAGSVKVYLCGSAGYDGYVGHGLDEKPGFRHCTAAGTMSVPIAEHCVAMMLTLVRQVHTILRQQAERRWERRWHAGEVTGRSACIVGLGGSGTELARRLIGLGMCVRGVRRNARAGHEVVREVHTPERLEEAVADADHVFCVLPGGPHTRHMFNARTFAAMKRGAFFYSASRGSVTDEAALIQSLQGGHLAGAGLDVFEEEPLPPSSPLWDLPNVIVSPHSAGHSEYLAGRLADLFVENLNNLRNGNPLRNEIDVRLLH